MWRQVLDSLDCSHNPEGGAELGGSWDFVDEPLQWKW